MNVAVSNLEQKNYRVAVSVAGTTVHPVLGSFPTKGCIPLPIEPSAQTVTTDNAGSTAGVVVRGTGTAFLSGGQTSRVEPGDFLANSDGVLRRVKFALSDTMLHLEAKFPSSLSGAQLRIVRKNSYKKIYAKSVGSAASILQEQSFAVNEEFRNEGSPVSYDVSAANNAINFVLEV